MSNENHQKNSVKKGIQFGHLFINGLFFSSKALALFTFIALAFVAVFFIFKLSRYSFNSRPQKGILSKVKPTKTAEIKKKSTAKSSDEKETEKKDEEDLKKWNLYSNLKYKFSFKYPNTWLREDNIMRSSDGEQILTVKIDEDSDEDFSCFEKIKEEIIYDRGTKLVIRHFKEIVSDKCKPKNQKVILMRTETTDRNDVRLIFSYKPTAEEKRIVSIFNRIIETFTFFDQQKDDQLNFEIKSFFSPSLGITFNYPNIYPKEYKENIIEVQEKGNKVYIYRKSSGIESGQFVEVFFKDPTQTLEQAIKEQFLKNFSEKECFVKTLPQSKNTPPNFTKAIITFPKSSPDDKNYLPWIYANKCPQTYTTFGGVSYFAMDLNHPDKFFFFSIGQYAIVVDEERGINWEDTFRVLE